MNCPGFVGSGRYANASAIAGIVIVPDPPVPATAPSSGSVVFDHV